MKTIHKLLIALGAVLALVAVALVLLVRGAFSVANAVVDTTANTVDAVVAKVKEPDTPQQKTGQDGKTPSLVQPADPQIASAAPNADGNLTSANAPVSKTPPAQNAGPTPAAPKPAAKANAKNDSDDDTLASVGKILGMVLGDDGDGDFNPADVLNPSDKSDKDTTNPADKQADKVEDKTGLAGIVPGADSPTLQKAIAGKYKGKEGQIIDDALDDPKAWRLLFFLGGGM